MSDTSQKTDQASLPAGIENLYREPGATDNFTESEFGVIARRLGTLVLDESTVLADHQKDAFDDIVKFYREGGRETYVQLPTSTGKTVLFVEVCKRLVEATPEGEESPRIIVLVPIVDLVGQTVGEVDPETGKRRGFKGFAPELDVRPHHSKIPSKVRDANIVEADILVTTYSTFRNLISNFVVAESKAPEQWESEKANHEAQARIAEINFNRLKQDRASYLNETFTKQEIARARTGAALLLKESEENEELKVYQENLQAIINITNLPLDNQTILRRLKRKMRSLVPEGVDAEDTHPRRMLIKEFADKAEADDGIKPDPVGSGSDEIDPGVEPLFAKLNPFEQFVVKFVRLHRPGRKINYEDIKNFKQRQLLTDFTENLKDARASIHFHRSKAKYIDHLRLVKNSVSRFDLIVCDEAHRSIGTETWEAIRAYAERKDIAILGLTATDEYYDRSLEDYFEKKAHDLSKQEAMKKEIVNPVALFVHNTGLRFQHVGIDASGDYDRLTIRQMRFSEERNLLGVEYAKMLSEHGYHGIIPAIPGDDGEHAKVLAELINQQQMVDPKTGEVRAMRAKYVLADTENRKEYYKALEAGELDWLTFIDVIREGWDSDSAKAIINMRPTRSPLLATQRLGRIGRTYEGAPVSVAIDLFDGIESQDENIEIPPVLASDVFEIDGVEQGFIVGSQKGQHAPILNSLRQKMTQPIEAHHTRFVKMLEEAYVIDGRGIAHRDKNTGASNEWQTFEALRKGFQDFLPKEIVLDAVNTEAPTVRAIKGRRGSGLIPLFNAHDVHALHLDKPEVNPWKLHVDEQGHQWITPEGCTKLLSKRFPHLLAEQVSDAVRQIEAATNQPFQKDVGRVRLSFGDKSHTRTGFTHMYKLDEVTERLVPFLIESAG